MTRAADPGQRRCAGAAGHCCNRRVGAATMDHTSDPFGRVQQLQHPRRAGAGGRIGSGAPEWRRPHRSSSIAADESACGSLRHWATQPISNPANDLVRTNRRVVPSDIGGALRQLRRREHHAVTLRWHSPGANESGAFVCLLFFLHRLRARLIRGIVAAEQSDSVAQRIRALPCGGRGRAFESPQSRQHNTGGCRLASRPSYRLRDGEVTERLNVLVSKTSWV